MDAQQTSANTRVELKIILQKQLLIVKSQSSYKLKRNNAVDLFKLRGYEAGLYFAFPGAR